jgi:hypothetical protein
MALPPDQLSICTAKRRTTLPPGASVLLGLPQATVAPVAL